MLENTHICPTCKSENHRILKTYVTKTYGLPSAGASL